MLSSVLLLTFVGVLCFKSAVCVVAASGSKPAASSGKPAEEDLPRSISVLFKDGAYIEGPLKRSEGLPVWMKSAHHFDKYYMYISSSWTFTAESTGPQNLHQVNHNKLHIPTTVMVEVMDKTGPVHFITNDVKPYHYYDYAALKELPFNGPHGPVFGYAFIGIKNTSKVFVAYLYIHKSRPPNVGHVGSPLSTSHSSGGSTANYPRYTPSPGESSYSNPHHKSSSGGSSYNNAHHKSSSGGSS